jgi:precorrin-6B methylase 2
MGNMSSDLYEHLAAAYVRGMCPDCAADSGVTSLLQQGRATGLKLRRFKRTMGLPRVRAVLGALRGIDPATLIDFGTGRGVFLWPLLAAFPSLEVTAVERDERRTAHLNAVRTGGVSRLHVVGSDAARLPFPDHSFDAATMLEVLEHQEDPISLAREAVRLAGL